MFRWYLSFYFGGVLLFFLYRFFESAKIDCPHKYCWSSNDFVDLNTISIVRIPKTFICGFETLRAGSCQVLMG